MKALLERTSKLAYRTLYTEEQIEIGDPVYGETLTIYAGVVERVRQLVGTSGSAIGGRVWEPQDVTDWTFRAAIGNSWQLPIAGSFTLTFGANTTAAIAYNATASAISTALNAIASIISAGGVSVAALGDSYFSVSFLVVGTRAEMTSTATGLAPLSLVEVATLVNGTSSLKEVQTIRLLQNPAAFADLTTDTDPAAINIAVLQVGGLGLNHKIRVLLTPMPYDGSWTLNIGDIETPLLDFDISEADLQTALEALSSVGTGAVQVSQESEGVYLIAFQGSKADVDMGTIIADDTALKVVGYKWGVVDLRVPGVELLLNGESSVSTFLQIIGTPPGGTPESLLLMAITLLAPVQDPAATTPQPRDDYYTKSEVTALIAAAGAAPAATVVATASTTAPAGWLLCIGQAVSRTTYAALYALLGTTFGAGDGVTTFNIPDLRGRVVAGLDVDPGGGYAGRLTTIYNAMGSPGGEDSVFLGASNPSELPAYSTHGAANGADFDAVSGISAATAAHDNTQPTLLLNYIIKT